MLTVTVRTSIIYAFLILLLRLLGKRQLGEMEPSEFVVAALIANLAAHPLEEHDAPLFSALLPIAALSVLELATAFCSMPSRGILDINEVLYAILETNGTLNVIPIAEAQPVTAGELGLACGQAAYPSVVISEGRVMDDNLRRLGFGRGWLDAQLRKRGRPGPESVFLMTADADGNGFFCEKDAH